MQSFFYHHGYGYRKRVCEDVTSWFLNKFLPRHKIELEILHRGLRREYVHGYCSVQDCDWRPRDFLIEIQSNLSQKDYIQTLFHELYHCYQHIKGDLRDIRGIRCWKGMKWDDDDYDRMPWEIEAYQKEKELYEKYLNTNT
jgi:hypothetical protein